MADVDIAPRRFGRDESSVLDFGAAGSRLLAIVEGFGGWGGSGVETAEWVRDRLAERWSHAAPHHAGELASDVDTVAKAIPEELRDSEWGEDFSFAAALLQGPSVQVVAQGRVGVLHFGSGGVLPLYTPGTWVMEQVAAGRLTEAEALEHPLRTVSIGPAISSKTTELFVHEPVELQSAEGIVMADLDLFWRLLREPMAEWVKLSALQLQALVGKNAVIKITAGAVVA